MEPFTILLILTTFIVFILFFATIPVFNYIVTSPDIIKSNVIPSNKIKQQPAKNNNQWISVKPTDMTNQQAYNQYYAQKMQEQFDQAGGIQEWIEQNPTKLHPPYQRILVEIWTIQFPYLCLYSNMHPSRINKTAQELTEEQGYNTCLGDPTCDVMTLISELVHQSEQNQGCVSNNLTQTWSFPRSEQPHKETSIVFQGTLLNKNIPTAAGRDVLVRIIFNPKPSPALFRTNWQDVLPNKPINELPGFTN